MKCPKCNKNNIYYVFTDSTQSPPFIVTSCKECFQIHFGNVIPIGFLRSEPVFECSIPLKIDPTELKDISQLICDKCGTSLVDIKLNSLMGCERCYEVFSGVIAFVKNNLDATLDSKNDVQEYTNDDNIKIKKETLSNDLKIAIANERYEQAAKIRDELQKLEAES